MLKPIPHGYLPKQWADDDRYPALDSEIEAKLVAAF
jgi:hypothetical protein